MYVNARCNTIGTTYMQVFKILRLHQRKLAILIHLCIRLITCSFIFLQIATIIRVNAQIWKKMATGTKHKVHFFKDTMILLFSPLEDILFYTISDGRALLIYF